MRKGTFNMLESVYARRVKGHVEHKLRVACATAAIRFQKQWVKKVFSVINGYNVAGLDFGTGDTELETHCFWKATAVVHRRYGACARRAP